MSDKIKPYKFIRFDDTLHESKNNDPLINFEIKSSNFIPKFKSSENKDFKELFILKEKKEQKNENEVEKEDKIKIEEEILNYINEKKREAEKILENAYKEAEEVKKKAYDEGFKNGFEEGKKEGESDVQAKIKELILLINKIKEFEKKIIKHNEENLSNIIIKFAKKIIKKELEINSNDILSENIKYILSKIVDKGILEIKINPSQFDFIMKKVQEIKEQFNISEINLSTSNEITPGGCIIETNFGNYDARIEEQIAELEKILTNN